MSMNIYIANIKINAISNIGSLNIGKSIVCRNNVKTVIKAKEPLIDEDLSVVEGLPPPALIGSPGPVIVRPPPLPPPL